MIIIVDGYNMLKQKYGSDVTKTQIKEFTAMLMNYGALRHHKVLLVFDGGSSKYKESESYGSGQVIYVGGGRSADDYIVDYVTEHASKELLIVSADRKLCNMVQHEGASCIDPESFGALIRTAKSGSRNKKSANALIKTTEHSNDTLDLLMHQAASQPMPLKQEQTEKGFSDTLNAVSKKDKKLLERLKKL